MILNKHFDLEGRHAFLSASKPHWVNYSEDKMTRMFIEHQAASRGTRLHALAHEMIKLGVKMERLQKTLNMYVNDGIGYRMTPEQPLYYSDNAFGTADTLAFRNAKLRIHDLKTGFTPAKFLQLQIYAAYFCLEYDFSPFDIDMEFRIYQNDDIQILEGDPTEIFSIMEKTKTFDKLVEAMRVEELL